MAKAKTQLDIFGRASGAVKGSDYTPWWSLGHPGGGSTFASLYNRVNYTFGVVKKSLKLYKHRKNVLNRAQIVDPTLPATASYGNSRSNYNGTRHWSLKYGHIRKALAFLTTGAFSIYLNDIWANLKTKQAVDVGSAIHQKLHQIYSNRMIQIPEQFHTVIDHLITCWNARKAWRRSHNKEYAGIGAALLGMDPLAKGEKLQEVLHPVDHDSFQFQTNLSTYVAIRQFLINNQVDAAFMNQSEELENLEYMLEDMHNKDGEHPCNFQSMQGFTYEMIMHMLEDVYIDDRLADKAPGYVKYLTKFKENKVKDKKWLKNEVEFFEYTIREFMTNLMQRAIVNDQGVTDSDSITNNGATVLNRYLIPMREYVTLHAATAIMRYIITLPELINEAVEKHLDCIIQMSQANIKHICEDYGVDEHLFSIFDAVNVDTFEKHLREYSSMVTADILTDSDAVISQGETMFSYYQLTRDDILASCTDKVARQLKRAEESQVRELAYNVSHDDEHGHGLSQRMQKEIGQHVDNKTEHFNTQDPGVMQIRDSLDDDTKQDHKVIIDHFESGNPEHYSDLLKKLKPQINALRRKIELYGLDRHIEVRNLNRGAFDRKALHKIPTGYVNLFKKDYIDHEPEMNIGILMDQSGSMYGEIGLVRDTAIMLYEAIKGNRLVTLFLYGHNADKHREGAATHVYEYNSGTSLTRVKADACNRDGVAIYEAAKLMLEQINAKANTRNVLFVLCDGQPSATGYRQAVTKTARSVRAVENMGISVASIGMGRCISEEKLATMYRHHFSIESVEAVQTHLPQMIRQMLKI